MKLRLFALSLLVVGAAPVLAAEWQTGSATKDKPVTGPFVVTFLNNSGGTRITVAVICKGKRQFDVDLDGGMHTSGDIFVPSDCTFAPTVGGLLDTPTAGYSGYKP